MSDWASWQPSLEGGRTWGDFFVHAREYGVTIETLESAMNPLGYGPVQYLRREVGGETLTYVMPQDCTPDRKMGFQKLANVCARLRLPEPKWFIVF